MTGGGGLPPRFLLAPERRARLVEAARGRRPADLVLAGGHVVNVYTGELERLDLGIAEGRVAWLGEGDGAERVELDGAVVAPGLIEPHGHPDIGYTPSAVAATFARQGATTIGFELHGLLLDLPEDDMLEVVAALETAAAKILWRPRPQRDVGAGDDSASVDRAIRLLPRLGSRSIGELTTWPQLLEGDATVQRLVDAAIRRGLQVDAHAAGSSPRTLGMLAAAGLTSEHEAIRGDEVVARLRLGFHTMLRSSSVRDDAVELALHLVRERVPLERVMLTTDGRVAQALVAEGSLDGIVRKLVAAGIDAVAAVRMATLAPAAYLGLDAHVGGLAPGRCADLVVVPSLEDFQPQLVLADGAPVERADGIDWRRWPHTSLRGGPLTAERLRTVCAAGPALRLAGLITRRVERSPDDLLVALVDQDARWIVGCTLAGLRFDALASTHTGNRDVLLAGRDADAMVAAYRRVVEAGGGVATPQGLVPLPILGTMFDGTVEELAAAMDELTPSLSLPPGVPLEYLPLFLTIASLPDVRITSSGVLDIKSRTVLAPPAALS